MCIQRTLEQMRKKNPLNLAFRAGEFKALPMAQDTVDNRRRRSNCLGSVLVNGNLLTRADYLFRLFIHESVHCYCMLTMNYNSCVRFGDNATSTEPTSLPNRNMLLNRRIFVYTFCLINIWLSLSDDANKIKALNIERA